MCEGYQHRLDKKWEIARWQICLIYNSKLKKGASQFKPSDFIKLSFDKPDKKSAKIKAIYTPEEYAQLKKRLGIG